MSRVKIAIFLIKERGFNNRARLEFIAQMTCFGLELFQKKLEQAPVYRLMQAMHRPAPD